MAFIGEPKREYSKRSRFWNIDQLKEDLRSGNSTLTSICKRYAEDSGKWRALYNDVTRWKKTDSELTALLEKNRIKTDPKKRTKVSGGRPRKDKGADVDFRVKYCEELLKTKSRNKAAMVTPYSPEEIYQMLNENYSSYDRAFAEMVHFTEMRLVAWAEEVIWESLNDAKFPKDRAWIAKEILKVRDRQRWGDKLDVSVTATHTHRHKLDPGTTLKLLEEDRSKYFQGLRLELPANVIDAEVVDDEQRTNDTD